MVAPLAALAWPIINGAITAISAGLVAYDVFTAIDATSKESDSTPQYNPLRDRTKVYQPPAHQPTPTPQGTYVPQYVVSLDTPPVDQTPVITPVEEPQTTTIVTSARPLVQLPTNAVLVQ